MFIKGIVIFCLLALSGCSTIRTIGPLPTKDNEFTQPLDELRIAYPEIKNYEHESSFFGHCTDINDVIAKLGKPNEIQTEWFQVPIIAVPIGLLSGGPGGVAVVVIGYGMYPKQPKNYVWLRGNYKITARVLVDISCRYNTRIHMMEWIRNP